MVRRLDQFQTAQQRSEWRPALVRELHGATMAIIGLGNIGCAVARVANAFGMREADGGGQLRVTSSGILSGRASTSGADWDWIVRAVPPPKLEGRPLPEFLAWAEREGGRSIRFADPALERANRTTIVYGAIERLTVDEALDVVLPSCGLARRTERLLRRRGARLDAVDLAPGSLIVTRRWLGPGYGYPTAEGTAAGWVAAAAGLTLDPVYTAKAFAALLAFDRHPMFGDAPTVFVDTYGPR